MVHQCKREILLGSGLVFGVVFLWTGLFKSCSVLYRIGSLILAEYLVLMEIPKRKITGKENQIYKELLLYLSRVKHRYVSCRHVANAILDAAEDMSYEIQCLAGELYRVLMGSNRKEEVRDYIMYHQTNRYLKLFLIQAYEASETGDVAITEGTSLFASNVEHLRLELMEEIYRRKQQNYEFAGYIFVAVTPGFMMPVLKQWGLEFAPELAHFYAGYGQLLELLTISSIFVIYGLINKAKDIALFHGKTGEVICNLEWLYESPGVSDILRYLERAEGKISIRLRQLILLSGERMTYGKLCLQMAAIAGITCVLLLSFIGGIHENERRVVLTRMTSIDTIAPVASEEKKAMLSAHILEITKQCLSDGVRTEAQIRERLRKKIRLSNETMEMAAVHEIQSRINRYEQSKTSTLEVLSSLLVSILAGIFPVARLWFQVQASKAGAVLEVRQFQSIVLMERRLQGITIVGLLEDMEVFSQSFRNVLRKCINTYGAGPKAALLAMKEEGGRLHESFSELADAFLSVDEVGIALAFAEVDGNRKMLERMNRLETKIALEHKKDNTDLLSKIPMFLTVGAYFVLPFFLFSLQEISQIFELLEELQK